MSNEKYRKEGLPWGSPSSTPCWKNFGIHTDEEVDFICGNRYTVKRERNSAYAVGGVRGVYLPRTPAEVNKGVF